MITGRYFKFKNIKIGNHGTYVLTGVSNLETGTATSRKINYIDTDGAEYADIYYNDRVFEISGIIRAYDSEAMVAAKRRLISACSLKTPFELEYFNRSDKYIAECYFDKLPTFSERKQWFLPFKLYLRIPGFYWYSALLNTVKVYSFVDNVTDEFTLPCIFTSRISIANVYNSGDSDTYPTFTVTCHETDENSKIEIKNVTSDKLISVNHTPVAGEVVTIDTFEQTVHSSISGNITNKLDISTEFFTIGQGTTQFEALCYGSTVLLMFRERYLGV